MTISSKDILTVIPAKAGIQERRGVDSRLRGSGLHLFRPFLEQ